MANFVGSEFVLADFIKTKFFSEANFSKTQFLNGVNFSGAIFNSNFILKDSKLIGPSFIGTNLESLDCGMAKFESGDFLGAKVNKDVNFIGTKFNKTSFTNAKFEGNVDFTGAKLEKSEFLNTQFADVNFSGSEHFVTTFSNIKIQNTANFERAKLEKVDFIKSKFKGDAVFGEVDLKEVKFHKVIFKGVTNFNESKVENYANFKESQFNEVHFDNVKFLGEIDFCHTKFKGELSFIKSEFNKVDFTYAKIKQAKFINTNFKGISKFNLVIFENPKEIIFDVKDLSKVSFMSTDITDIKFGENVRWGGNDSFKLIDEEIFVQSPQKQNLESLLALYRNLRENYENRFRYEDAKKIFEREINLKKEYGDKSFKSISDPEILSTKIQELTKNFKELKKKVSELETLVKGKFS